MLKGNNLISGVILLIAALHSGYALMPIYSSHLLAIVALTIGSMFFFVKKVNINTRLVYFLSFVFIF